MQAHDSHAGLRTAGADPRTAKAGPRTADAGPRQSTQVRTMTWPFTTACTGTRQPRPLRRPMTALQAYEQPTQIRTADAGPRQLTQAYSSPRGTGYGFFTYGES